MSTEAASTRKRKPTAEEPEVDVLSNSVDDIPSKSKARRVSTDASTASTHATAAATSHQTTAEEVPVVNAASTTLAAPDSSLESIGQMIQDLFHSDNARVNAALYALIVDLDKNKKKCDNIQAVGGWLALVQLLTKCLDKAIDTIPACDQVIRLNELAELTTLYLTLNAIEIISFFCHDVNDAREAEIAAIGGLEAVVKTMKTFPNCVELQERACGLLRHLVCCSIGKAKAIKSGAIEVLLAAINNHLGSANLCEYACWALSTIATDSKENTGLLISMYVTAAVAKVKNKWPDDGKVRSSVKHLTKLIVAEMNSWV
jgi:hypothetical protein